ncbi:MAG: fimbrillin family protein [Muribaculaceae bacterium]|nr:fimbrillin family protein [Muribaculaceae bacterium]
MDAKLTYLQLLSCMACVACTLSSCSADTPEQTETGKGYEMSFDVSGLSRGSVTTSFNEFAVYGDSKSMEDLNSDHKILFNKTVVKYKDGSWSYDGTQYWLPGNEHSFIAISPVSAVENANTLQYLNSQLSFTYNIPTVENNRVIKHDDIADIVVSTHRRLYNDGDTNARTTFNFGHVMSLINIAPAFDDNIMNKEEYISIVRLELSGFKTKASFNITPAPRQSNTQTDDRIIEVTGQEKDGTLTVEFDDPVKVANDRKNVNLFDNNDALIMLPQAFASDSDARIVLSYRINDEASLKQITLPLTRKQWDSGKSYTYKFTFNRIGMLSESTSITEWDVSDVGNIDAH